MGYSSSNCTGKPVYFGAMQLSSSSSGCSPVDCTGNSGYYWTTTCNRENSVPTVPSGFISLSEWAYSSSCGGNPSYIYGYPQVCSASSSNTFSYASCSDGVVTVNLGCQNDMCNSTCDVSYYNNGCQSYGEESFQVQCSSANVLLPSTLLFAIALSSLTLVWK